MVPGDRRSFLIETGGYAVEEIWSVHFVLDVFLAGPHDLDWAVDMLRDLDGARDTIDLQPPAESTADQMIVDDHLVQGQASGLRRRRLGARDGLAADPNFAAVLAYVDRAVHRLHRGVCEERDLVGRLDPGDAARQGLANIANILRNRPRIERRPFELGFDIVGAELGVRPVIPFDGESRQPFLGRLHVVGHDRDGVVEPYDLTHAPDRHGRFVIHTLHAAAKDWGLRKRRDLHALRPNVDAKDGCSVDLGRRIQTLGPRPDQREIARLLERDVFRDRQEGGVGGEVAIAGASPGLRMKHVAALRMAGSQINIPPPCRGRHEHGSCGRTGLAQRLPRPPYRVRVASCLHPADQGVAVKLFVGRSMLQAHLIKAHFQLFGDQHRDRGVGPLAHLDIGHDENDLAVVLNADEGVGREAVFARRAGFTVGERQAQAQHQAAGGRRADLHELAP